MTRKGYEFRNHTADVELVAHGKTLEEAFANALLAMFDTSADIGALKKMKSRVKSIKIKDEASNLEDLLWVTLQDALSLADSKGLYCYRVGKVTIKSVGEIYSIATELFAKDEDPKCSVIYVKGVSRFDLKVAKRGKEFIARAVLDV